MARAFADMSQDGASGLAIDPWGEVLRSALFVRAVLAVAAAFLLSGTLLAAPATSISSDRDDDRGECPRTRLPPLDAGPPSPSTPQTRRSGWTQTGKWGSKAGAMQVRLDALQEP